MKRIIALLLLLVSVSATGQIKISQLPTVGPLTGAELFPVVQSSVTSKASLSAVQSFSLQTPLNLSISGSPSSGASGQLANFQLFYTSDSVDSNTNGPGWLDGFAIIDNVQAGHTGGRSALYGKVAILGAPAAPSSVGAGYVGAQGIITANTNLTGTGSSYLTYASSIFGANGNAFTQSGATFLKTVNGAEFDSTVVSGSSTADHYGISIVEGSNHAVPGAFDDSAISINNQDGVVNGWNFGVSFGSYAHHWAFTTTSTLIGAQIRQIGPGSPETDNALNGVDFRNVTFASGGKAFASPGFSVDGPTGMVKLPTFTVGTLPTCNSGSKGSLAYVTDATAPTYNAALTGGGAVIVPVFCNGTAWTSH